MANLCGKHNVEALCDCADCSPLVPSYIYRLLTAATDNLQSMRSTIVIAISLIRHRIHKRLQKWSRRHLAKAAVHSGWENVFGACLLFSHFSASCNNWTTAPLSVHWQPDTLNVITLFALLSFHAFHICFFWFVRAKRGSHTGCYDSGIKTK